MFHEYIFVHCSKLFCSNLQPYFWLDNFLQQSLSIVTREVVKATDSSPNARSVLHGSSALASILLSYSFESLLVLNSPIETAAFPSTSMWKFYRRRVKQYGHASLFRGVYLLAPVTLLNVVTGAIFAYFAIKLASLHSKSTAADAQKVLQMPLTKHAMELVIQLSSYPLETIRFNMIQQNTNNFTAVARDLYHQGGVAAFFSGVETIVLQSVVLYALDRTVKPTLSYCKHKVLQWFK